MVKYFIGLLLLLLLRKKNIFAYFCLFLAYFVKFNELIYKLKNLYFNNVDSHFIFFLKVFKL